MLTEALEVMEKDHHTLEKELKVLKMGSRSQSISPAISSSALAQLGGGSGSASAPPGHHTSGGGGLSGGIAAPIPTAPAGTRRLSSIASVPAMLHPHADASGGGGVVGTGTMWDNLLFHGSTAAGSGSNQPPTAGQQDQVRVLSRLLSEWRQLAVGKITSSLQPLPRLPCMLTSDETNPDCSSAGDTVKEGSGPSPAMASKIYRFGYFLCHKKNV